MSVVEWAEKHRKLSKESSNGGRFLVSRVEVSRGPMLAVTEPGVQTITLQACTQLLKTTFIENVAGYFIHLDPCPILVVQPKDDAAETFSKDRLAPMIRDNEVLQKLFAAQSRDAGNTLTHKQFPGGHITMVGANSPINLAMRPIRLLLADEIDKYPLSAGNEGPPVELAEERQAEFTANKLSVRACSPTIEGRSAIAISYEESDKRKAFVSCPHCSHWQHLEWERVHFDKDDRGIIRPETASYACAGDGCGVLWTEADRLKALQVVKWRQTKDFFCCGKHQTPERWVCESAAPGIEYAVCIECGKRTVDNSHAGFIASKIYAPKQTMKESVRKYKRALERGQESLKTFFNTQIARTWKESGEAPEWDKVFKERDKYISGTVPLGALILFAGVDVQKDRLEVGIWGFGRNRQRWLIEHRVLPGQTNRPEVWRELETMFTETWRHESGTEMSVRDWGIDTGAFAPEVGAFVRSQQGRGNVHAVDGLDRYDAAFLGVGGLDITVKGKKLKRGLKTLKIGVSYCKQELVSQLALVRAEDGSYPPGFVHLPSDVTEDHVKQLTSESLVTKRVKGRMKREWQVIEGRRNEVLDCSNYSRGVASMRGWDRWRDARFNELESILSVNSDADPDHPTPAAVMGKPQRPARRVRHSSWMS